MTATARRGLAWAAATLVAAALSACSDGRVDLPVDIVPPAASQDRLPPRATVMPKDILPFATAARQRVAIHETVTRSGEPLAVGSIELPEGWSVADTTLKLREPCESWRQCVLWEAVSPDGRSRLQLVSPRRGHQDATARGKAASASIATRWLRDRDGDEAPAETTATATAVDAAMPATRKGWSAGGAWLSSAYEAFDVPMRELRALDVETRRDGAKLHRVQSWPMLVLRMPAAQFDAAAAEALRRSLQFDPAWVPAWWLGWEARTIGVECTRGFHGGYCHVGEGYADYFRGADSLGLWDTRSDSAYDTPSNEQYDPAARQGRR